MRQLTAIIFIAFSLLSCASGQVKEYELEVVAEYPHDTKAYTQGLFFNEGSLYESTGLHGESSFRQVDLQSGEVLKRLDFDEKYFIEGSVMFKDNLYILTWESRVAFIYDAKTLKYKSTWKYPRQGWGITTDGKRLIASDGSSYLYLMDENFSLEKRLPVTLNERRVHYLNELEYIDKKVWANVYTTDEIVIINPKSGEVEGVIDCNGLLPKELYTSTTDVLNGIAYNEADGKIYLTGKNWPKIYEVRLVEK